MKRLVLFYRGRDENGRTRTLRISVPAPIDQIDAEELSADMQLLKEVHAIPSNFEPDEARIIETNVDILVNLIE